MIDPDSAVIEAPGFAFTTRGPTDLIYQANAIARVNAAIVPTLVIGVATDNSRIVVTTIISAVIVTADAGDEFGATAAIHPDTSAIVAPGGPFDAGGAADLTRQANSTGGINIAVMAPAVIGGTTNPVLGQKHGSAKNRDQNTCKFPHYFPSDKKTPDSHVT